MKSTTFLFLGSLVILFGMTGSIDVSSQRVTGKLFGIVEAGPPLPLRTNFNGIDDEFDTASPDLAIAAGEASVVLVRNQQIVIREKTGGLVASVGLSDFFRSVRDSREGVGDPQALYDASASRFFVITDGHIVAPTSCAPGACVAHYLLAVSKTSNPRDLGSNSWYFWSLDRTRDNDVFTTNYGDFDHIAVTNDALIITSSMYGLLDNSAQGIKVRIIDKAALVSGAPISSWKDLRDDAFGRRLGRLLPVVSLPPSDFAFLVSTQSSCGFILWRITGLLSTPTMSSNVVNDRGNCQSPPDAPQPGGGQLLDVTGVGFNSQPVYHNGSVWVANTILTNYGTGPVPAVYVAQIDVSRWPDSVRTLQSWTIGEDRVGHFAPALMVDGANNMALVYARSSTNEFASAYYSGRLASDALNTFRQGMALKVGENVVRNIENGRNRFTDYFSAALDPADDSIWLAGLYAHGTGPTGRAVSGGWLGNLKLAGTNTQQDARFSQVASEDSDSRALVVGNQRAETAPVVTGRTTDGVSLRVDLVAGGLNEPSDVAIAPDGRIFVAERGGRVQILTNARAPFEPALVLADLIATNSGGLLGFALDPRFEQTHFVYALYTTSSRTDGQTFRLARFRELSNTLAERAILLDGVPASRTPSAALRFGPDGKLYVAFDDGGNPRELGDMASYSGKILRLNSDGSMPTNQFGMTPVYSPGYRSPRGFDWQPGTDTLWTVGVGTDSVAALNTVAISGVPQRAHLTSSMARDVQPPVVDPSALAFYRGETFGRLAGDLLAAADDGRYIFRLRFDAQNPRRIVASERLVERYGGGIRGLTVSARGEVFFCTEQALFRLVPADSNTQSMWR